MLLRYGKQGFHQKPLYDLNYVIYNMKMGSLQVI